MERREKVMSRCSERSDLAPRASENLVAKLWMIGALTLTLAMTPTGLCAQQARKAVSNPQPEFPEVAKKMNLSGVVKIEIVIGADGQIKDTKVVGGHPLLIDSVQRALKKWKFTSSSSETTELLEFKF
jgi:TonB family protein